MGLLLIIDRELRAMSRTPALHRFRFLTVLVSVGVLAIVAPFSFAAREVGGQIFGLCRFYLSAMILFGAPLLTIDLISRERREGTLGFLFLTDLSGFDVVVGKYFGAVLNPFLTLLAVIPIAALSLLFGGVQIAEFWRGELGLVLFFFYGSALGLAFSCFSKQEERSAWSASGCLLVLSMLPLADNVNLHSNLRFSWFSPMTSVWEVGGGVNSSWGPAMVVNSGVTMALLLASAWKTSRGWRREELVARRSRVLGRVSNGPASPGRSAREAALLDSEPVRWLVNRRGRARVMLWTLAALCGLCNGLLVSASTVWAFYSVANIPFLLYLAAKSGSFFSEARRTGAIELLLVTPLTQGEIVGAHVRALSRLAWLPCAGMILLMESVVAAYLLFQWTSGTGSFAKQPFEIFMLLPLAINVAGTAMTVPAIIWMGTWLSLKDWRVERVVGVTILLTIVIPMFIPCLPIALANLITYAIARSGCASDIRRLSQLTQLRK